MTLAAIMLGLAALAGGMWGCVHYPWFKQLVKLAFIVIWLAFILGVFGWGIEWNLSKGNTLTAIFCAGFGAFMYALWHFSCWAELRKLTRT